MLMVELKKNVRTYPGFVVTIILGVTDIVDIHRSMVAGVMNIAKPWYKKQISIFSPQKQVCHIHQESSERMIILSSEVKLLVYQKIFLDLNGIGLVRYL